MSSPDPSSRRRSARLLSRRPRGADAREAAAAAVVLLGAVAVVAIGFWPGHMSTDTLSQIAQVIAGRYNNWHAPLVLMLWRPFFLAGAGPGWVLMAQLLCFVGGAFLVLRAVYPPLVAAVLAAAVALSPQLFGLLGYVGRDTWFVALATLAAGVLVRAAQRTGRPRMTLATTAVVVLWLTLATRQNGIFGVAPLILAAAALLVPQGLGGSRGRRALVTVAGAAALVGLIVASQAAILRIADVRDLNPEQVVQVHDLAAISLETGENLFPRPATAVRDLEMIDELWDLENVRGMIYGDTAPVPAPVTNSTGVPFSRRDAQLRDAWVDAVLAHPLAYLEARAALYVRQIGVIRPGWWVYHPQIDANPHGYAPTFPAANRAARGYVEAFLDDRRNGPVLHRPWPYLLLAAVATVVLLRTRHVPGVWVVAAFAAGALTYQVGVFLGTAILQYRFEYPAIAMSMISTLVLLGLVGRRRSAASAP